MASIQPRSFGELLRRYRIAAGLTQEELAEQAGLSARAIGALETGARRAPRKDTVALVAKALGLTSAEHVLLASAARQRLPATTAPQHLLTGAPAQAPSVERHESALVGRRQELLALGRHLAGEGPPLLVLAGEPGIGKSRLLEESARRASEQGWTVLAGGCHRRSGQEPYAPFVGALTRFLAIRSLAQHRLDLQECAWLVRLLPELAELRVVPAPDWKLPPEQERRLMFAAVARFLTNVAGPAGTLLVLDDLHWAGGDALDLLAALLCEPGAQPLRIVGAYRDTDVGPHDPLPLLLGDLTREGLATRTSLPLLDRDDARELLSGLLAGEAGEQDCRLPQVDKVLDRVGGLPLFLVSWIQELRTGSLAGGAVGSAVPWSAAESIRQRVAVLPEAAQDVLAVAAVAGRQTPRMVLLAAASASGQDEANILAGLDAACCARLLAEAADGSYVFTHDLVRETIATDLGGARRAALHRRVAETLERQPQAERRAAELAWHFAEGDEPARALPYALQAGDQAEAVYAHEEAERHYRMAAGLARELGDQAREAQALERLDVVLYGMFRMEDALAALESAAALRQAMGDLDQFAWDTAQMARAYSLLGQSEAGLARLQALLTSLAALADHAAPAHGASAGSQEARRPRLLPSQPGVPTEALGACATRAATLLSARTAGRVYLSLTIYLSWLGHYQEAIPMGERAVAHARVAGDGWIQARTQAFLGQALAQVGQGDRAVAAYEAAGVVAEAARDLEGLYLAYGNLGEIYQQRGAFDQAARSMMSALEAAERSGMPDTIGQVLCGLGEVAYYTGEWDQTRAYCERAVAATRSLGYGLVPTRVSLLRGTLCLAQGHTQQAQAHLDEAITLGERSSNSPALRAAHAARAEQDLLSGCAKAAYERLMPLLDQAMAIEVTALLPLLAWAHAELGDMDQAEAVVADSLARATAQEQRLVLVDALRIKALLATRQGRWEEAEAALKEVLALCQAMPYPYAEAKALYVYGQLHEAKGEPERARERYEQALAICNRLGERLYAERIEGALMALHSQP